MADAKTPAGSKSKSAEGGGRPSNGHNLAAAAASAADEHAMMDRYHNAPPHPYYGAGAAGGGPGPYQYPYGPGHMALTHGHMYGSGGPPPPGMHGYPPHHPPPAYMNYPPNGFPDHGPPPPPGYYPPSLRGGIPPYASPYASYGDLTMGGAYADGPPPHHHPSYPGRRSPPSSMAVPPDADGSNVEGKGEDSASHKRNSDSKADKSRGDNFTTSQDIADMSSASTHAAGNVSIDHGALARPLHLAPRTGHVGRSDGPKGPASSSSSHPTTITIPANANETDGLDGMHLSDPAEVDRLRQAAATEITPDKVEPIRTDFHFFVKEHREEHLRLAQDEVLDSVRQKQGDPEFPLELVDPMLINTNLNTRLMRAWEHLSPEQREIYMAKEEDDRRRFMEEDEIASRHCATLTARGKSPRTTYENARAMQSSPSPSISSSNSQQHPPEHISSSAGAESSSSFAAHENLGYSDEKNEEHSFEEKKDDTDDYIPMSTSATESDNRSPKRTKTE